MYGLPKSVCCACDPSLYLDVPSIGFVCVSVCRKLSAQFERCLLSSCYFFV